MNKPINFLVAQLIVTSVILFVLSSLLSPSKVISGSFKICPPPNQVKNPSTWDIIRKIFCRRKEKGSTQGGGKFCSLSPNMFVYVTWSERPLFIWEGTVRRIEVRLPESDSALWSYQVGNEQSVLYNGEGGAALQPGQEYVYWVEYEDISPQGEIIPDLKEIYFKVMDKEEHQHIQEELTKRGLDYPNTPISKEKQEELALQRAKFFGDEKLFGKEGILGKDELFLDVVRELFSVPSPSPDFSSQIEALRSDFCE